MGSHLSRDQITECMVSGNQEAVAGHLETCDACRAEVDELQRTLACFRDSIHAAAQRDDGLWRKQRLTLSERLSTKRWFPSIPWNWAAAAVLVLIAGVVLTRSPNPPQRPAREEADDALLREVQMDLGRGFPEALAPAVLIAEERNEILTREAKQKTTTGSEVDRRQRK